jgi:hypothetical protein
MEDRLIEAQQKPAWLLRRLLLLPAVPLFLGREI